MLPNQSLNEQVSRIFSSSTLGQDEKLYLLAKIHQLRTEVDKTDLHFTSDLKATAFGRIVALDNNDLAKVYNYFVENEAFEFDYFNEELLTTVSEFEYGVLEEVGEFEPDWKKFLEWAKLNNVFVFLVASY